jgi:hypothetical protein
MSGSPDIRKTKSVDSNQLMKMQKYQSQKISVRTGSWKEKYGGSFGKMSSKYPTSPFLRNSFPHTSQKDSLASEVIHEESDQLSIR